MAAIVTLLLALVLSLVITRAATIALTFTGLARESARFQARSAFTGVGFTTSEAEDVVGHPVRRRILMLLMLCGNVGIVTVVSSVVVTFVDMPGGESSALRLLLLAGGLALVVGITTSRWIDRWLSRLIEDALRRWTTIDVHDYAKLLHLCGEYSVVEMAVAPDDWLAGRALEELALDREGVLILGIRRPDGAYIGVPGGRSRLCAGDTLMVYGRVPRLAKIAARRRDSAGEACRVGGVAEQREAAASQPA
jgi:TrkA-C domain